MPRDGNGTYVPVGSDFVNGTVIQAPDVNAKNTDMANAITQSVSRDGQSPMTGSLPMGNNKIEGLANGTAATDAAALGQTVPTAGLRNLIINGNPRINQRGYVSGAPSGGNGYTLDRWRVVVAGQALTWTDSAGIRTVTAPAGGVEQIIEGLSILPGDYTLSWTGTATAMINGVAVANGGKVTLPGLGNAVLRFTGGTFSRPQLEPGALATPFELRPLEVELALCQRYYEIVIAHARAYAPGANAYQGGTVNFAVTKRVNPSLLRGGSPVVLNAASDVADRASVSGFMYSILSAGAGDFYIFDRLVIAEAEL